MLKLILASTSVVALLLAAVGAGSVLADGGVDAPMGNAATVGDHEEGNPVPQTTPGDSSREPLSDLDSDQPEGGDPDPVLFRSVVDEQSLTVPVNLTDPIRYDDRSGNKLTITRAGVSASAPLGRVNDQGIGVFLDTADQVSTVIVDLASKESTGFAILEYIEGSRAPEVYRYEVDLPAGYRLKITSDGGVAILNDSGATESLTPPPWAFDSMGTAVPVSYAISGSVITMRVDHRATTGISYPIVADPCWSCLGKLVKGAAKTIAGVGVATHGFAQVVVSARFGMAHGVQMGARQMVRGVTTAINGVRTMASAGQDNRAHRKRYGN